MGPFTSRSGSEKSCRLSRGKAGTQKTGSLGASAPCSPAQARLPAPPHGLLSRVFPFSFQVRDKERLPGARRAVRKLRRGGRLRVPRHQEEEHVGGRIPERF